MNIALALLYLFPNADPRKDFIVRDDNDGNGPYIKEWNLPDPQPTLDELQAAWDAQNDPLVLAKAAKIAELRAKEAELLATFQSSALGTPHTYLSGINDMILLTGEFSFVTSSQYDGSSIPWYTLEEDNVIHTGAQMIQVWLDGRSSVANVKITRATLEKQVTDPATDTVDKVNAIVWPGSSTPAPSTPTTP